MTTDPTAPILVRRTTLNAVERSEVRFALGGSVGDLLRDLQMHRSDVNVRILVGDRFIARADWETVRLVDHELPVVISVVPAEPVTAIMITVGAYLASAASAAAAAATFSASTALIASGSSLVAGGAFALTGSSLLATFAAFGTAIVLGTGITYGVGMLANLAVSALVKPSSSGSMGGGPTSAKNSPTLHGTQNTAYPYSPVWRVFGEYWATFPLVAKPYTETVGGDSYLRMLFTGGYGPLDFDSFKIGDTDLGDFDAVELEYYDGIDYWKHNPADGTRLSIPELTLFRDDVVEIAPGAVFDLPNSTNGLVEPSDWAVRSGTGAKEVSLDLTFAGGLYRIANGDGRKYKQNVEFDFEQKSTGAPDSEYVPVEFSELGLYMRLGGRESQYQPPVFPPVFPPAPPSDPVAVPGRITIEAKYVGTFTTGLKFIPVAEDFTVRVRRFRSGHKGEGPRIASATWTALRSIRELNFSTMPNVTLVALRIKATDQLNGTVSQFRSKVYARLRQYLGVGAPGADVNGWGTYQRTRNPAWAYLQVLTGQEAQDPLPLSRVDLARIQAWAAYCEPSPGAYVRRFDCVFDFAGTVFSTLQTIAGVARGTYGLRDTKHSVVLDVAKASAVQMLTPRNSWAYKGRRRVIDYPHALRVNFPNELKENKIDELIYYSDGYAKETATRFETLELIGVTGSDYAWEEAWFHDHQGRLRPEMHEVTVDVEYLSAERGDRIILAHDVPSANVKTGRVTLVGILFGARAFVDLDESYDTIGGTSYTATIRWMKAGELTFTTIALALPVDQAVGEERTTTRYEFATPVADDADHAWEVGDLVAVGVTGSEKIDALVHQVSPESNLSAVLLLTDYVPALFSEDAPPVFDSELSDTLVPNPPIPEITGVESLGEALLVSFKVAASVDGRATAVRIQAQYRTATLPPGQWTDVPAVPAITGQIAIPLDTGVLYDLRLRSVGATTFSAWAYRDAVAHTGTGYTAEDYEISGFEVKNRGDSTEWAGRDLEMSWRLKVLGTSLTTPPEGFAGYRVTVSGADGIVRRRETLTDPRYNYSLARNQEDSLRLTHSVSAFGVRGVFVQVSAFDVTGLESQPLIRFIENNPPNLPTVVPSSTSLGFYLEWSAPPDPDATKLLVWRGPTSNFEIGVGSLIYEGLENPIFIDTRVSTDSYYRWARADEFSEDPSQLIVSDVVFIDGGDLIGEDDIAVGAVTDLRYWIQRENMTDPRYLTAGSWTSGFLGTYSHNVFLDFTIAIPAGKRIVVTLTTRFRFLNSVSTSKTHHYTAKLWGNASGSPTTETLFEINDYPVHLTTSGLHEESLFAATSIFPRAAPLVDTTYELNFGFAKASAGLETDCQYEGTVVTVLLVKR